MIDRNRDVGTGYQVWWKDPDQYVTVSGLDTRTNEIRSFIEAKVPVKVRVIREYLRFTDHGPLHLMDLGSLKGTIVVARSIPANQLVSVE